MIRKLTILMSLFASITAANCQNGENKECTGGWAKYEYNPVLGGHIGTVADLCILRDDKGIFHMYTGWRETQSIAMSESKDGITWTVPVNCLLLNPESGWEDDVNRPVVIRKDGIYHMWYSGQVAAVTNEGHSYIGYATSSDGKNWKRMSDKPVLKPEAPWEKGAVMCPHVIWDDQEKIFKMWYSAGGNWEPDGIGYATSKDGLNWQKYKDNPVFSRVQNSNWEDRNVTGCQVIKRVNDYLMFYIGFGPEGAQEGMARSKDGITAWERYKDNPLIRKGKGWDNVAVFKPYAMPDPENNRWLLYYNGCHGWHEQTGVAFHEGMDLGF
jgi:beta-1,2-mannobiose phosphorylase / 1,2-beta-oligomannan phosphorylase